MCCVRCCVLCMCCAHATWYDVCYARLFRAAIKCPPVRAIAQYLKACKILLSAGAAKAAPRFTAQECKVPAAGGSPRHLFVAVSWRRKMPEKVAGNTHFRSQEIAGSCRKLPEVAGKMPEVAGSCRKLPEVAVYAAKYFCRKVPETCWIMDGCVRQVLPVVLFTLRCVDEAATEESPTLWAE